MKQIIFAAVLAVSASASAFDFTFPDFGLMTQGQKNAVKTDKSVKDYAANLGAASFAVVAKATTKVPVTYTVNTNNGCSFDVEVVYEDNFWDGIKDVVVIGGTKSCD